MAIPDRKKYSFFYRNGLSLVFILLMILSLSGQVYTGWKEHNDFLSRYDILPLSLGKYLMSGHFLQATFENWESEFLQMALFVVFTIFLRQQGSSESKKMGKSPDQFKELVPKPDSPWPVKRGGIALTLYKHSLSIALFLLFVLSFILHLYGSWIDFNETQSLELKDVEALLPYLKNSKFWFEIISKLAK